MGLTVKKRGERRGKRRKRRPGKSKRKEERRETLQNQRMTKAMGRKNEGGREMIQKMKKTEEVMAGGKIMYRNFQLEGMKEEKKHVVGEADHLSLKKIQGEERGGDRRTIELGS